MGTVPHGVTVSDRIEIIIKSITRPDIMGFPYLMPNVIDLMDG